VSTASGVLGETHLVRERDGPEGTVRSAVVAARLELADTFATRFWGLMGRAAIAEGAALWLEPCSSIHMMFVRFPIDVVFVDRDGKVLKVASGVRPWLGMAACAGARAAIELAAGAAQKAGIVAGDRLARRTGVSP
jgi:uncharacterized membrane protein (UPF0127 family)